MWLADIAVNQIFQEELAEEYRGDHSDWITK